MEMAERIISKDNLGESQERAPDGYINQDVKLLEHWQSGLDQWLNKKKQSYSQPSSAININRWQRLGDIQKEVLQRKKELWAIYIDTLKNSDALDTAREIFLKGVNSVLDYRTLFYQSEWEKTMKPAQGKDLNRAPVDNLEQLQLFEAELSKELSSAEIDNVTNNRVSRLKKIRKEINERICVEIQKKELAAELMKKTEMIEGAIERIESGVQKFGVILKTISDQRLSTTFLPFSMAVMNETRDLKSGIQMQVTDMVKSKEILQTFTTKRLLNTVMDSVNFFLRTENQNIVLLAKRKTDIAECVKKLTAGATYIDSFVAGFLRILQEYEEVIKKNEKPSAKKYDDLIDMATIREQLGQLKKSADAKKITPLRDLSPKETAAPATNTDFQPGIPAKIYESGNLSAEGRIFKPVPPSDAVDGVAVWNKRVRERLDRNQVSAASKNREKIAYEKFKLEFIRLETNISELAKIFPEAGVGSKLLQGFVQIYAWLRDNKIESLKNEFDPDNQHKAIDIFGRYKTNLVTIFKDDQQLVAFDKQQNERSGQNFKDKKISAKANRRRQASYQLFIDCFKICTEIRSKMKRLGMFNTTAKPEGIKKAVNY